MKEANQKINKTKMWLIFTIIILAILFGCLVIMFFFAMYLMQTGVLVPGRGRPGPVPYSMMITLLFASALIATAFLFFICNKILVPISKVIDAMRQVANGNFDIRLNSKRDMGEVHNMNESFNSMVKELSGIETLRNDFVSTISHEFKSPLASIEGYATMLQSPDLTKDELVEYSGIILESTRQLSSLSSSILNISKLESQDIAPEKNVFRLDEQIRQAILILEPQWTSKNIDLNIDLRPVQIKSCENLLMQVWVNIIGNAIKFTPKNGSINITMSLYSSSLKIAVADTGIGMSEAVSKHIFDKFYQGDSSRATEGNGLGLALVKRILQLTNGDISVESKEKQGSVFTVTLPL